MTILTERDEGLCELSGIEKDRGEESLDCEDGEVWKIRNVEERRGKVDLDVMTSLSTFPNAMEGNIVARVRSFDSLLAMVPFVSVV